MSRVDERGGETAAEGSTDGLLQPSDVPPAASAQTVEEADRAEAPVASAARTKKKSGGIWSSVGRSAGVKILVLPVSAILGVVNVRLIIDHFGTGAFAQYGLLVAIGNLLPFADLGISAAVMNVVGASKDPRRDPKVHAMLVSTIRILIGSFAVLMGLAVAITALGLWGDILGEGLDPATGPLAAALCLAAIAVSLLFGFSQRILAGVGKNHVSIGLLGLQTPMVLAVLLIVINTDSPIGPYIAVVPYLATLLIQLMTTGVAAKLINPTLKRAVRDVPRIRTVRGGKVFDVAWPMMIQMVALPFAMQTDRLMLSHFSTTDQLAEYNLASQMFTPVWQVVSAAGFALWPIFAKQRSDGQKGSPLPISLGFGGAAAVVTLVIAGASPWLADLASGGEISVSLLLVVVFSVFMVFQALKYPLGMYLTDAKGLRFQAYMILLMAPVNILLSYWLTGPLGAAGPVIGSLVGVAIFQYAANLVYVRRRLASTPDAVPAGVAGGTSDDPA
ncbi:lipopolysaccharide biosynthesis protein [Nakamurella alba]|uniref:lipopolysaccharide biosynthesis protein n=1 Tax=Nakamurella alba TaxID=2665158 RepID=UPI0018AA4858|nr:oligosaccharide flippase family protein [Nakamurella alba]